MKSYTFSFKIPNGTYAPRVQPIQAETIEEAVEKVKNWFTYSSRFPGKPEMVLVSTFDGDGEAAIFNYETLEKVS